MKEIKFRAWLKDNKKMVDVISLEIEYERIEYRYGEDNHLRCYAFEGIDLMQFTGLYDKNGTPIYEGDIIGKYFVRYDKTECAFELFNPNRYTSFPLSYCVPERAEVIGNIYENEELLRGERECKN